MNCQYCNDHTALINTPKNMVRGYVCQDCIEVYNINIDADGEPCTGSHLDCEQCDEMNEFHREQMAKFNKLLSK